MKNEIIFLFVFMSFLALCSSSNSHETLKPHDHPTNLKKILKSSSVVFKGEVIDRQPVEDLDSSKSYTLHVLCGLVIIKGNIDNKLLDSNGCLELKTPGARYRSTISPDFITGRSYVVFLTKEAKYTLPSSRYGVFEIKQSSTCADGCLYNQGAKSMLSNYTNDKDLSILHFTGDRDDFMCLGDFVERLNQIAVDGNIKFPGISLGWHYDVD